MVAVMGGGGVTRDQLCRRQRRATRHDFKFLAAKLRNALQRTVGQSIPRPGQVRRGRTEVEATGGAGDPVGREKVEPTRNKQSKQYILRQSYRLQLQM